mgnify:FL=1|jgi:hypothetical protein
MSTRFFIGNFKAGLGLRNLVSDRIDLKLIRVYFDGEIVDSIEKYADRIWTTRSNQYPPSDNISLFCEIDNDKYANWFLLKYPNIEIKDEYS